MKPWHDEYRDVALAVFGAATGVASILLVFVGFLMASAASVPSSMDDRISERYVRVARVGVVLVVLNLLVLLATHFWFFSPTSVVLLKAWSWGFPLICFLLIPYAVWAAWTD